MKKEGNFIIFSNIILPILIILALLFLPSVSASQDLIALKQCSYSLNDNNFGPWDGTAKGVFLKITNTNPIIGGQPNYTSQVYQPSRNYYNNFNFTGNSIIPILKVDSFRENRIYINCSFVVGATKLYISTYFMHAIDGLFGTSDYNFTKGIIKYQPIQRSFANNKNESNYSGSSYSYDPSIIIDPEVRNDDITYVNNGIDPFIGTPLDYLKQKGFYPNTEPYVISSISINNTFSGLAIVNNQYIITNNVNVPIENFKYPYYINSSMKSDTQLKELFYPIMDWNSIYVRNSSGKIINGNYIYKPGEKINFSINFSNPYNFDINLSTYSEFHRWDIPLGIGTGGTDIAGSYAVDQVITPQAFKANKVTTISFINTIPDATIYAAPYAMLLHFVKNASTNSTRIGGFNYLWTNGTTSDGSNRNYGFGNLNESYLGIYNVSPRITLSGTPTFSIGMELCLESLYEEKNDAYNLLIQIKNETSVITQENVSLVGLVDKLPICNISSGLKKFTKNIVIDKSKYPTGPTYTVDVYTVKNKNSNYDLNGKIIAKIINAPSFTGGEPLYGGDVFTISNITREEIKKVTLFNPYFDSNNLSMNLTSQSDRNNISVCYSENIAGPYKCNNNYYYSKSFAPLETKDIFINVSGKYSSWPMNDKQENFNITIYVNHTFTMVIPGSGFTTILTTNKLLKDYNFLVNVTAQNIVVPITCNHNNSKDGTEQCDVGYNTTNLICDDNCNLRPEIQYCSNISDIDITQCGSTGLPSKETKSNVPCVDTICSVNAGKCAPTEIGIVGCGGTWGSCTDPWKCVQNRVTSTNCTNGVKTFNVDWTIIPSTCSPPIPAPLGACKSSYDVSCREVVLMPFFNYINLIIALMLIGIVYFINIKFSKK